MSDELNNVDNFVDGDEVVEDEVTDEVTDETEQQQEETSVAAEDAEQTSTDDKPVEDAPAEPQQVPLTALQEERTKRQSFQQENLELQDKLAAQEKARAEQPVKTGPLDANDPNPTEGVDDDDYDIMTPSEQRRLTKAENDWQLRENAREAQFTQNQQLRQIDQEARQRFSDETMGKGLDFDNVVKAGKAFLTDADRLAIQRSPDPGKAAYDLCIERCPYLSRKTTTESTATNKDDENKSPPAQPVQPAQAPNLSDEFKGSGTGELADSFVGG